MTKADIIESIYKKLGFSKKESAEIVELVFDTMKDILEKGEKIKISGFGNFLVRDKKSRVGRNPQTGKEIEISARRVLTFRPSQVLKNILNGLDESGAPLPTPATPSNSSTPPTSTPSSSSAAG
jgi:integration host factor subunit alpha